MHATTAIRARGAAVLGLVLLAGCKTGPTPGPGPVPEPPMPSVSLKGPGAADVQVALGRTVESQGDVQRAIRCYREATRNDPTRVDAWCRIAVLSDKEGLFAEAEDAYRRALELDPGNADTHTSLGYSLYLQERWADAESALRQAVALKPDHRRALNNLGLVLARSDRAEEALAAFQQAGCSEADAHLNLAYARTLGGDLAAARTAYERTLALDPSSGAARKGLESVKLLAAKLEPAGEKSPDAVVPTAGVKFVPSDGVKGPDAAVIPAVVQPTPAAVPGR